MTTTLTPAAAQQLKTIMARDGHKGRYFRVAVEGGGCSGFQYVFSFDDEKNDQDFITQTDGVTMVVDDVSLSLMEGASVDYVKEMIGASFQVANPNATAGCGCGTSFSI